MTKKQLAAVKNAAKNPTAAKAQKCRRCGKLSTELGAMSRTCPSCQDDSVEELEELCGVQSGSFGRVAR